MDTIQQNTKLAAFATNWKRTTLPFSSDALAQAESVINTLDFPTSRVEDWKYTRVTKISNKSFEQSSSAKLEKLPTLPLTDAHNVVFVNGIYQAALSSQGTLEGIQISQIEESSEVANYLEKATYNTSKNVFHALNTLHAFSGIFIHVHAKQIIEKPIQIVYVSSGQNQVANIRNVIVADKFSEARITQVHVSDNATDCFTNVVSEYFLADNAKLIVDKMQYEDDSALSVNNDYVQQPENSIFTLNTITLNGLLVRNNVYVAVDGQNSTTNLNGAYILKDAQHVDNHTYINHLKSNCYSNERYKGVIDDKATAVFNGKIHVQKDAQKIDSYQSNGNVLLSDTASVNSKPELEIYADDVKCSHGSTTGQLDEEAIYYLRARGISKTAARALMVSAFIGDVLEQIENEEIIDYIHHILEERCGWSF